MITQSQNITSSQAILLSKKSFVDKTVLKTAVIINIGRILKRKHHRFKIPYEAEGRRIIVYMDGMRAFGRGRDNSWALSEFDLEDLIILFSEITNNKQ